MVEYSNNHATKNTSVKNKHQFVLDCFYSSVPLNMTWNQKRAGSCIFVFKPRLFFKFNCRFTGENFGYHVSQTTDENGEICMPFMAGRRVRITLPCKGQSRVVQVWRTASTCRNQASLYDFPKSTSAKTTENDCEEYTFVVKSK